MNLLSRFGETYTLYKVTTAPDGFGGFTTTETAQGTITAAITRAVTIKVNVAASEQSQDTLTVTTHKDVTLHKGDVLQAENGKRYIVTTDADANHTPQGAGLDMRQCEAEG